MDEPPIDPRPLLAYLEEALAAEDGDADPARLQQVLEEAQPGFLNLLHYKPSSLEAREQVKSGNPITPYGTVPLDQDPDVREVLLLSDELRLDEITAVVLVQRASEQTGEVSAAAAAGAFFEERRAWLDALALVLSAPVARAGALAPAVLNTVGAFAARLLAAPRRDGAGGGGGGGALLARLAELIASNGLAPGPGSRLPSIVDAHGRLEDRAQVAAQEQTALCECLLYAMCLCQRVPPRDVGLLLDTLRHLALRARAPASQQLAAAAPGGGAPLAGAVGDVHAAQLQAGLALLAALLALLPIDVGSDAAVDADEGALLELVGDRDLDARICGADAREDPHAAAVKLAWGLLLLRAGREASPERGAEQIRAANEAGALGFLRTGVLDAAPMADEAGPRRQLAASVLHQLVLEFVDSAHAARAALEAQSRADGEAEISGAAVPGELRGGGGGGAAPGGGGGLSMMAVDAGAGRGAPARADPDSLASLLSLLAAVFRVHPALYLECDHERSPLPDFMWAVGCGDAVTAAPSAFLAFMDVLAALAGGGELGAAAMFMQLRAGKAWPAISWRRFFEALAAVVRHYAPPEADDDDGAPRAVPLSSDVLSAWDSAGLCAYARLLERAVAGGRPAEVAGWLRALEDEAGAAPAWEPLFQAMCCPVPQDLKAALDGAIAAIADKLTDAAPALWDRLLAAVVVAPAVAPEAAGAPRYDLAYQLNEVEARAEDYCEAVAFVRLLTALWRASGPSAALPDEGRCVAHLSRFVRDEVLAPALQRAYRDDAQRWALVAACLEHCEVVLCALRSPPDALAAEAVAAPGGGPLASLAHAAGAAGAAPRPPGLDVLLDLLGERATMRAALATLSCGVAQLAAERHSTPFGAAKEAAALAALRLLRAAFEYDAPFAAAAARAAGGASYQTLDAVLRHDRRRLPALLDFVRYAPSPAVQAEALRLASHLAARLPALVPLLLNAPPPPGGDEPTAARLQFGLAACLQDAVFGAGAPADDDGAADAALDGDADGGGGGGDAEGGDPRAALVLRLLLGTLAAPAPNLAHLACGYGLSAGMGPGALPPPRAAYSALRVVLDVLGEPRLAARRPRLYETAAELVYYLAASPETGAATLDLLRSWHGSLAGLLAPVVAAPLPASPAARAASLHQRAWLLHIHALELHHGDPAVAQHRDSMVALLGALCVGGDAAAAAGDDGGGDSYPAAAAGRGRLSDALEVALAATPQEPSLAADAPPEARRMLAALEVDALLGGEGLRLVSARGDALLDVVALKDEVVARVSEWAARHGPPPEELREAGRAALRHAQRYNAYVEQLSGQAALLGAWEAATLVAYTARFELLAEAAAAAGAGAAELALAAAEECCAALAALDPGVGATLAPPLCEALQALLARLHQQVAGAPHPAGAIPLPDRCVALLQALLGVLWLGRASGDVRQPLYSALCSYMALCRGPALLRLPPGVARAALAGSAADAGDAAPSAAEAMAQTDALQAQLEDGNAAVLQAAGGRLVELLAADSGSPVPALAASALAALAALAASDAGAYVAGECFRAGLPSRLLQDLQDQPFRALTAAPPAGQALLLVAESQLALLLRLVLGGPPAQRAAAAQKLFEAQALPALAACPALDLQPEEPGAGARDGGDSLRGRLARVVTPALRLAAALLAMLPHSAAVREQAAAFVAAHERTLVRLLHEAASPGVRGWEPGDDELEAATAAAQLLALLARPRGGAPPPGPALREAAYRAASRLLAPAPKSPCPVVARLAAAREAGRPSARDRRTFSRLLALRTALARFLHEAVAGGASFRATTPVGALEPPGVVPTLFLLKDALLQAAVDDLPDALGEAPQMLDALRRGGGAAAAAASQFLAGDADAAAGGPDAARLALARAAAARESDAARLAFLVEHLLAVLYLHLRGAGADARAREALGSARDLDQLRRLLEPVVAAVERLAGDGAGRDGLGLLVRRLKEALAALA